MKNYVVSATLILLALSTFAEEQKTPSNLGRKQLEISRALNMGPFYMYDIGTLFVAKKYNLRSKEECGEEINDSQIDATPSGPMGPTRFQGTMGICFSYSTSDALTYCLHKNSKTPFDKHISAIDIAIQYALRNGQKPNDLNKFKEDINHGGIAVEAMNALYLADDAGPSSLGTACLEENFTSDPGSFHRLQGVVDEDYFGKYIIDANGQKIYETEGSQQNKGTNWLLFDHIVPTMQSYVAHGDLQCAKEAPTPDHGCFPTLSKVHPDVFTDSAFMKLVDSAKKDPVQLIADIDQHLCDQGSHRRVDVTSCKAVAYAAPDPARNKAPTGHFLFKEIDKQLNRHDPVVFSARDGFLKTAYDDSGPGHSMLIIGRRWKEDASAAKGGTCQYRIRNSWGPLCYNYYSKKYVKECEPNTGYLWIDEETLDHALYEITLFSQAHLGLL